MRADGPVLVALDGSSHSPTTLAWGLHEAALRGADAVLVRAYQDPVDLVPWGMTPFLDDVRLDSDARAYLDATVAAARVEHRGLAVRSRLLHGPAVATLREAGADASLLVLGATGGSGRRRLGSVPEQLTAHSRCPVVVVGGAHPTPTRPGAPVVVGVDGSAASLVAADVAAHEAALRGAPLVVVHARPYVAAPYAPGWPTLPPLATADSGDATHRAAREVVHRLTARHPGTEVLLELVDDAPAPALCEVARGAHLLVVGSRGAGGFRGLLVGSVSAEVVRSASCPVMVLHEHDAEVLAHGAA
ncbi:universal stress protein [Actinotalea solisilvae]|uniref:universal stress protein n=1 Tax=Actinotalea solisilvae TaxID=2072922 RepID=UPI0018F1DD35|nr:universal stress protein [Actinotalea solisilvae]